MPRYVITQGNIIPFVLANGDFLSLRGGEIIPEEILAPGQIQRLLSKGYAKQEGHPEPSRVEQVLVDPGAEGLEVSGADFGAFTKELAGIDRGERGGMIREEKPKEAPRTGAELLEERLNVARAAQKHVREALGCGAFCFPPEIVGNLTLTEATELARSIDSAAPVFSNIKEATSFLSRDLQKS